MKSILTGETLELWGGCECTINRIGDRFQSQLAHRTREERLEDLKRIAGLGIRTIRFPLLWEELAPRSPAQIDWSFADAQMNMLEELGLRPIVGLLHHGSGPCYTSLVDPQFPLLFADYARKVAERFPWVEAFTPINEPLTTARFSGLYGLWHPHGRSDAVFCRALLNQVQAIAAGMRAIREVNPSARLVQTEDLGRTQSTPALAYQAEFDNERRWLPFDLLTGRIGPDSGVWSYLRWAGVPEEKLLQILAAPCPPDVIGINHYITSPRFLDDDVSECEPADIGGNGQDRYVDRAAVRVAEAGFCEPAELLRECWVRYRIPIAITEAHLGCTREEQLRWLGEIWKAATEVRNSQATVLAVTAWSLLGAFDWDSLLTTDACHYETGVFDLRSPKPRETALAHHVRSLASGICQHPLLGAPGWWRRSLRTAPDSVLDAAPPRAFAPHASKGCPMLLIAGANGTLGQATARLCRLRGLPYRLLTRSEMDICDAPTVRAAISAFRPWALINAAGYVRVDDAEHDSARCFQENTVGAATLAEACAAAGIPLLTFSSDLVFDGRKSGAYLESDLVSPLGVYGLSKAQAEEKVLSGCPMALVIRTSAFFGPWDAFNFVTRTVRQLTRGETVTAQSDLWISPTYVPDLVHAALDLLIDREAGIWHLANSGAVTWADFGRAVARLANFPESQVRGCAARELRLAAPRPRWAALSSERGTLLGPWQGALERYFAETTRVRTSKAMAAGLLPTPPG